MYEEVMMDLLIAQCPNPLLQLTRTKAKNNLTQVGRDPNKDKWTIITKPQLTNHFHYSYLFQWNGSFQKRRWNSAGCMERIKNES